MTMKYTRLGMDVQMLKYTSIKTEYSSVRYGYMSIENIPLSNTRVPVPMTTEY